MTMQLTDLILWALTGLGMVYLFTESAIFGPMRIAIAVQGPFWESLIYCPKCVAFWVGLALAGALPRVWWLASGFALMGLVAWLWGQRQSPWEAEAEAREEAVKFREALDLAAIARAADDPTKPDSDA